MYRINVHFVGAPCLDNGKAIQGRTEAKDQAYMNALQKAAKSQEEYYYLRNFLQGTCMEGQRKPIITKSFSRTTQD
jgi:hypothetical protein